MREAFDKNLKEHFIKVLKEGWTPDLQRKLEMTEDDLLGILYNQCFKKTKQIMQQRSNQLY